jgi:hypothetical protein
MGEEARRRALLEEEADRGEARCWGELEEVRRRRDLLGEEAGGGGSGEGHIPREKNRGNRVRGR